MKRQNQFRFRRLISWLTTFSFLMMGVSGVILFLAPRGRIAHAVDWAIFGLNRMQWMGWHLVGSAVFVLVGVIHLILNRRAIWSYATRFRLVNILPPLDFWLAVGLMLILCWASTSIVWPIDKLMAARESWKNGEYIPGYVDPRPHHHNRRISPGRSNERPRWGRQQPRRVP